MYDCEGVAERHFQVEKSVLGKNAGAYFTFNISTNQRFETYTYAWLELPFHILLLDLSQPEC